MCVCVSVFCVSLSVSLCAVLVSVCLSVSLCAVLASLCVSLCVSLCAVLVSLSVVLCLCVGFGGRRVGICRRVGVACLVVRGFRSGVSSWLWSASSSRLVRQLVTRRLCLRFPI